MKGVIRILSVFVFIGVFLLQVCFSGTGNAEMKNTAVDFTLKNTTGEDVNLYNILKSNQTVLVFWATWCPSCRAEIPAVEKFYEKHKGKIAVFGVNVQESREKVSGFAKKNGMTYPILLDTTGEVGNLYGVRGIPSVIAIDQSGKVLYFGYDINEMQARLGIK
ncbi:MAG: TlpA family protein disulfide reductase [Candidatus Omnitrophica bacterium]|nr:TlpA family protein disulfide reductase [Candidatus Omnitrophota bacterium]